jgi:prepilin-type N-terminal cleavage/methylation domain-containing protein
MKILKFKNRGFTLVEMLIAVSLFVVVVTISMGALLSIFDANRNAQASKTVMDNLNLALENMARTIRFGTDYHCGNTGTISEPRDCTNNNNGSDFLAVSFDINDDGNLDRIIYRKNGTAIQRSDNGGVSYSDITSSNMVVEELVFRVFATDNDDTDQPYVLVTLKGYAGVQGRSSKSEFSIQTVMSQRKLDIAS